MLKTPVFPICPFFNKYEELDVSAVVDYIKHLESCGVKAIMTTAGTSQFNLLSSEEIRLLNETCVNNFNETVILGVPPLSERHALEEVHYYNNKIIDRDNVYLMLLYPDRYYDDKNVAGFFHRMAEVSPQLGVYFHGMFMRKGTGGTYNFDSSLISDIASHPNIYGMKEEIANLADAFSACLELNSDLDNFEIVVAGGSQRRFWHLHSAGATNFLSGIGSMFPLIDIDFYEAIKQEDYSTAKDIMTNNEGTLFKSFMKLGWHKSMREALRIQGFNKGPDRRPFASATPEESKVIKETLLKSNRENTLKSSELAKMFLASM